MNVIGEKILVKVKKTNETEGGIILPEAQVEEPWTGIIAGIGNYIPEETGCADLKVGDKITWMGGYGTMELIDGEEYFLIRPTDILVKYDK